MLPHSAPLPIRIQFLLFFWIRFTLSTWAYTRIFDKIPPLFVWCAPYLFAITIFSGDVINAKVFKIYIRYTNTQIHTYICVYECVYAYGRACVRACVCNVFVSYSFHTAYCMPTINVWSETSISQTFNDERLCV